MTKVCQHTTKQTRRPVRSDRLVMSRKGARLACPQSRSWPVCFIHGPSFLGCCPHRRGAPAARRPPREPHTLDRIPLSAWKLFRGGVKPVTSTLVLLGLPCKAGWVLGQAGPESVHCDWVRGLDLCQYTVTG